MERAPQRTAGRRRDYSCASAVSCGGGWRVLLDGRDATTPAGRPFDLPTRALAEALAQEFAAQGEIVDPVSMPLARLAAVGLDAAADAPAALRAEILAYAGSDLVLYRAPGPESLAAAQRAAWDPVLDWARESLGARFVLSEGVVHVAQPPAALEAVAARLQELRDPLALVALHLMTTLAGSALIALATLDGALAPSSAWRAAHVDETEQEKVWGVDAEADRRRARREADFEAAARLLRLVAPAEDQ